MTTALPNWVIDLVNALQAHEDEHGHPDDGHACLAWILKTVPAEVRGQAAAIKEYVARHQVAVREAHIAPRMASFLDDLNARPEEAP